jgi:cytochrome c-type biogenesis protein CcmH/NrfG
VLAGIERLDSNQPVVAMEALTEATARDPGSAAAWHFLGEAYRAQGRTADARAAYDRCLALDPNHGRAARARRLCD